MEKEIEGYKIEELENKLKEFYNHLAHNFNPELIIDTTIQGSFIHLKEGKVNSFAFKLIEDFSQCGVYLIEKTGKIYLSAKNKENLNKFEKILQKNKIFN